MESDCLKDVEHTGGGQQYQPVPCEFADKYKDYERCYWKFHKPGGKCEYGGQARDRCKQERRRPPPTNKFLGSLQLLVRILSNDLHHSYFPAFANLILPEVDEHTDPAQEQHDEPGDGID